MPAGFASAVKIGRRKESAWNLEPVGEAVDNEREEAGGGECSVADL